MTVLMYLAGASLLILACAYANANVQRVYVTTTQVSDFAGDVQAWLRSETR